MDEFAENIELIRDSIISIESSSWDDSTQIDRILLNGLLDFGYINETMLPWNSGRPILIRFFWGAGIYNVVQLISFEVL
ncbi:Uncharacterized protein BM_BM17347 [Brugia malayi]|uniref:Uncharacterized protein n=1 Tax=Brugia malayi TaxID=6279 RepID=A0A0K0JTT0_BRUMA|nr:Uncharacterized protein BM_BM7801 [Brugia malayi]XP_001894382.1 Uncharacterized protein BM_BM17347 [Brugia malayi]XP_042932262.1 Uncharacterized protein BM_BM17341 [Brugia malayi]XP_042932268.1 Uncharacterized protein BM_BM17345 [Brugia malayi]XP_042932270.1 Uncharacterized protein BM_BM17346 [Brugia malayi]VIO90432.1 Uncharacterized protein BM_BM17341 [Brugia malayi]VIO90442.1 Uncharacterized protein BM_BM17345 [Brugia malayi]VIO90443.1 Uncharacterized protein BM_BM7801 [Brugia malayi]V